MSFDEIKRFQKHEDYSHAKTAVFNTVQNDQSKCCLKQFKGFE